MPIRSDSAVATLRDLADLSVSEYVVLTLCARDDTMKFGFNPLHVNPAQGLTLVSLRGKHCVEFDQTTGKWELTTAGRVILREIPLWIHYELNFRPLNPELAEVIPFPKSPKELSESG